MNKRSKIEKIKIYKDQISHFSLINKKLDLITQKNDLRKQVLNPKSRISGRMKILNDKAKTRF